jgi:hypothetical protein
MQTNLGSITTGVYGNIIDNFFDKLGESDDHQVFQNQVQALDKE